MANEFPYVAGLRPNNNIALPVLTAQLIEVGDHVKFSTGNLVPATVAADDANLIGIAVEAKAANVAAPTGKLTVSIADGISRYRRNLDAAATVVSGDTLEIASKSTLTPGATDPAAVVIEGGTSVTGVVCIYKRSPLF